MDFRLFNIKDKTNLYYLLLLLMAISIPIIYYPRIYGVDAFQVMWMAQALKNGALFSENTWLIHPTSYFGYYPFSHRPIGIPLILAFLMSFIEFISFGFFGITEAILIFDIIIIILVYKSARNLGNLLFKEEWTRIVFVAAILLSNNIFNETAMTISTRIIILIIMINILNISLRLLRDDRKKNKFKLIIYLFILLSIGAITHRLWMGTFFSLIILIITYYIRKFKNINYISVFLVIPLSIIAFFLGLETFEGLFQSSILDITTIIFYYSIYYFTNIGLIFLFFPIGLIMLIYKMTFSNKNNALDNLKGKNQESVENDVSKDASNNPIMDENYYFLLLIIPFSFMFVNTFYTVFLFMPFIIIFSVKGLLYIKEYIASVSDKLAWAIPVFFFVFLLISYFIWFNYFLITDANIWNILSFALLFFFFFAVIYSIKNSSHSSFPQLKFNLNSKKLKIFIFISFFAVSTYTYSMMNYDTNIVSPVGYPYPWMNIYLTGEEKEIIEYFQDVEIDGLIFTFDLLISERLAGVGFLPTISDQTPIGTALYYGLISKGEVKSNSRFILNEFIQFNFYIYLEIDPISNLRNSISDLNLSLKNDFDVMISYNIQFLITPNETVYPGGVNEWNLIKNLPESSFVYSTTPVFTTEYLNVWKIY